MDPRTGRVDRPGVDRASAVLGPAGTPSRLVGGGSSRSAPSPNSDGDLDRSQGKASSPDCCLDGLPEESSSGDPRLRAGTWRTAETVSGCVSAGRRGRRAAIRPHQRFNEPFGHQPVDVGTGVGAGTIGGATGLHPRGPPLPQGARRRLVDGQSLTGPERRVSARRSLHQDDHPPTRHRREARPPLPRAAMILTSALEARRTLSHPTGREVVPSPARATPARPGCGPPEHLQTTCRPHSDRELVIYRG